MGYRKICDFIYDEFYKFDIKKIIQFDGMKIFVKTDFLFEFYERIVPYINKTFILYTHNSDICIDHRYLPIINNSNLLTWYGQNININNYKIKSIPIGIANRRWPHGDIDLLKKVMNENNEKINLIYCNINVATNVNQRTECLNSIYPIENSTRLTFENYLREISKSYFIVSPNGNGIDCHKTWESIYLKSIPIVTNSINISYYKNYPILIIDKWSDFKNVDLSKDLYDKIMEKYENLNNDMSRFEEHNHENAERRL